MVIWMLHLSYQFAGSGYNIYYLSRVLHLYKETRLVSFVLNIPVECLVLQYKINLHEFELR